MNNFDYRLAFEESKENALTLARVVIKQQALIGEAIRILEVIDQIDHLTFDIHDEVTEVLDMLKEYELDLEEEE